MWHWATVPIAPRAASKTTNPRPSRRRMRVQEVHRLSRPSVFALSQGKGGKPLVRAAGVVPFASSEEAKRPGGEEAKRREVRWNRAIAGSNRGSAPTRRRLRPLPRKDWQAPRIIGGPPSRGPVRHSRAGGNPAAARRAYSTKLGPRLRGNDRGSDVRLRGNNGGSAVRRRVGRAHLPAESSALVTPPVLLGRPRAKLTPNPNRASQVEHDGEESVPRA